MKQLDLDFVRQQFPVFKTELGQKIGFLDNAGGSYVAGAVIDRLTDFYTNYKVQPYGANPLSNKAGEAMDLGRRTMAELLNVSADLVTLGASSTQCFNTLSIACTPLVSKDSEVIVSEQDHESNIGGWERLCQQQGAMLKIWPVDPESGELALADLEKLLTDKTAVVAVTHSSNIIGTINPIREIAGLVHRIGAKLIVDGVSYAPHCWPDLDSLGADAYVFSTYKTYGTHMGVMVVREDFLELLAPQCHFFNIPYLNKRLDSAGPDHAAIAALAGIGDYFSALHDHHFAGSENLPLHQKARVVAKLMNRHENELCNLLLENLSELPVRILGRKNIEKREANIALASSVVASKKLADGLVNYDIAAKNGHFYAYRLLQAMGVEDLNDGVLRISLSHYNTREEVERCVAGLREMLG
ncbi:aminotransferase class V-fold PLP-dependent enzyme [Persicitalea jodogahamensis]|uniref:Cysteine desulfurase n=1 Tax=Persicitalea jodogahamensis TaxID=402147 RepID=A0A8J3G831_9BACT|nr:aminotransferase class V-fold PLP-dependent enzyme [Persicitalea jodogahamensis]GHB62344.1 cysteine desulfurase [Persicitalea jodogahamensis]